MMMRGARPLLLLLPALCLAASCITIFNKVTVEKVPLNPHTVRVPLRVHMRDGSTVLFSAGATVADTVRGEGIRYDLATNPVGRVDRIPLDSVVGMESFKGGIRPVETVVGSVLATGVAALAGAFLAVAIFGSCPTVYSDSAGSFRLEAESFSYSIVPLFEARDVDRLRATHNGRGQVELEVRNEALETHFLNHIELLAVDHAPEEVVHATGGGNVLAVAQVAPPAAVRDRAGRDVLPQLLAEDELAYQTAAAINARASEHDLHDYIDVMFTAPPGADSVALILRARNSLLTTVLFYDVMLARGGARSLDWVGDDLERLGPATQLGRWYASRLGLRISYPDEAGSASPVLRVSDPGPIAWKDLVLPVATHGRRQVRVRLSFIADSWRIDRIAVGQVFRRPEVRALSAARVLDMDSAPDTAAAAALLQPDERYLQTTPGHRFSVQFDAGVPAAGQQRTYFLAAQGYYTEWIRPQWIREAKSSVAFTPTDASLLEAMTSWQSQRVSLEQRFHSTRIPVR